MKIETVLVIDDEKVVLGVMEALLESLNFRVFTKSGGIEAIDFFEENQDEINLVLLDMIMPGMTGGAIFDALKKIKPEIKVLLLSGYDLNGQAQEILNRGCNGFLQKPFSLKRLLEAIQKISEE